MRYITVTLLVILYSIVTVSSGALTNAVSQSVLSQIAIQGGWKFPSWNTDVTNACNVWPGVICDTEGSITALCV